MRVRKLTKVAQSFGCCLPRGRDLRAMGRVEVVVELGMVESVMSDALADEGPG